MLKIFNAINAGAGLGLATALTTAVSVTISLDNKSIYSVAERPYDHIKRETFQTRAPASLQHSLHTSTETVLCSVFYCMHKDTGAHCSLSHFISKREINYVHAMSWSVMS